MGLGSYSMSDIKEFVSVGNYTAIAGGVTFHGKDNHPWVHNNDIVANYPFFEREGWDYPPSEGKGDITIGSDVWIGECARVLSGVYVGDGAIIGADCVVTKDVPCYAVMVGNPAKLVKYRYLMKIRDKLCDIEWWHWDKKRIADSIPDMKDVKLFVEKYG